MSITWNELQYADGYCLSLKVSVVVRVLPTAIQMASVSLFEGRGVRIFAITTLHHNPRLQIV